MVFSSTVFLFLFLPITLLIYYVLNEKCKNYWLLLVSLVFFAWSQPKFLWIILLNIVVNYIGGLCISAFSRKSFKRLALIVTIVINLGILFYFKYFNFAIDSINSIFNTCFDIKYIILPIGISFFTFQGLSYVFDVYMGRALLQKNITKLALYIVLFPQLIAGPIVRYSDIEKEISTRKVDVNDFTYGIKRFIIGLAKKVIIANTLAVTVDGIWSQGVSNNTVLIAWIGSIAYSLQIFFDFSGYSDMAIGLGRMFGFHFNENFDLPYISKNISEFWRRWHISLSSWFKDYVYIPLGGNRKRVYLNLAIVFLLTGIWHGAAWHFIIWGIWQGVFVLFERFIKSKKLSIKFIPAKLKTVLQHIIALLIINFGWILFRADHTRDAWNYIKTMFGIGLGKTPGFNVSWYLNRWTIFALCIGILLSTSLPSKIALLLKKKINENIFLVLEYI